MCLPGSGTISNKSTMFWDLEEAELDSNLFIPYESSMLSSGLSLYT